jgi:hypothetical protein
VVAILRPRDCLGDVGISITLGPVAVDIQFYLQNHLTRYMASLGYIMIGPA